MSDQLALSALGLPYHPPGGSDGLMRCPTCGQNTKDAWEGLITTRPTGKNLIQESGIVGLLRPTVPISESENEWLTLDWMRCENEECFQTVIRIHETTTTWAGNVPFQNTATRIVYPLATGNRAPAPNLVPAEMKRDYAEACAILDVSHRMSAVLARRILGGLLEKYAGKKSNSLAAQIDAFTAEGGHPSGLTSNLHHFREVGDFAAHTQETDDPQPVVIDVSYQEAEWTLNLVERLFDYFIVQPAKDEAIKASMDEKITQAGRKPLRSGDEEEAT